MGLAQKGMLAEAFASVRTSIQLSPERPDFVADLAWIQALMGQTTAARATLRRAKVMPFEPYNIGRAYVALGEPDSAFAWLERATWNFPQCADRRDPALDGGGATRASRAWYRVSTVRWGCGGRTRATQ